MGTAGSAPLAPGGSFGRVGLTKGARRCGRGLVKAGTHKSPCLQVSRERGTRCWQCSAQEPLLAGLSRERHTLLAMFRDQTYHEYKSRVLCCVFGLVLTVICETPKCVLLVVVQYTLIQMMFHP